MDRKGIALFFSFILFLVLSAVPARSDDLRCGSRLVSTGDSKGEVIAKCGYPSWTERWEEEVYRRISPVEIRKITVTVEEGYYNLGPDRFIRILRFENGILVEIRTNGYGY